MTTAFDILPAIDLRDGRVVRLEQGDFARETAYADDPVAVARTFVDAGARWLHVVDLDGARSGEPVHGEVIARIVRSVGDDAMVEVAGGLRTAEAVRAVLACGAARVVIGTAALRDPSFAARLVDEHGSERIAVAIDVRDGRAVGEAWAAGVQGLDAAEAVIRLADVGIGTFEATAIDRDGTGVGPDLALYEQLVSLRRAAIVASAGIATRDDIAAVRSVGCTGAIVGRALYDGRLTVRDTRDAATATDPIPVRRVADGELLGAVQPDGSDGWLARTVFGGTLARVADAASARAIVRAEGLGSMARRWFYRPAASGDWQVVIIQEAWPDRVRVVLGAYPLAGAPTLTISAADLAAGATLTLDPPPESGLDQFRS